MKTGVDEVEIDMVQQKVTVTGYADQKKVLKKVNFLEWKREGGHRETLITGRYHMGGRDDYKKFVTFSSFFVPSQ